MNKIPILDGYFLRSDKYQWMVSIETGLDDKGVMRHRNLSFHAGPHQALVSLGSRLARELNCDTLASLLVSTEDCSESLSQALSMAEQIDFTINMEKTDG